MRYLIFLILLFPIMSNAQSKWSIGLMASPDSNTSKGRKLVRTTLSGGLDFHQIKDGEVLIYNGGQLDLIKSTFWMKSFSINAGFLF